MEEKEKIEVQDVAIGAFKSHKEAARLIAMIEGLELENAPYWLQQPTAAFSGLGQAIRKKLKTAEEGVSKLSLEVDSLKKELNELRSAEKPSD